MMTSEWRSAVVCVRLVAMDFKGLLPFERIPSMFNDDVGSVEIAIAILQCSVSIQCSASCTATSDVTQPGTGMQCSIMLRVRCNHGCVSGDVAVSAIVAATSCQIVSYSTIPQDTCCCMFCLEYEVILIGAPLVVTRHYVSNTNTWQIVGSKL
jgi:hypothetical protein